jgi:hypothetical protein
VASVLKESTTSTSSAQAALVMASRMLRSSLKVGIRIVSFGWMGDPPLRALAADGVMLFCGADI